MKIGIFGGTFNPVHNGHLNISKYYLKQLSLDKLLVIPSNIPPHKDAPDLLDKVDRYNICRIAFHGIENIEISDIEIKQEGAIRTVDTLEKLQKKYQEVEFYLIIGGDLLFTFKKWKDYKTLLKSTTICVGARSEKEKEGLEKIKKELEEEGGKILFLDVPVLEISSTEIRKKIYSGRDFKDYLDNGVYEYIKIQGLYGLKKREVQKYLDLLERMIKTKKRKTHSINVAKEALTLGINNGANSKFLYIAGVLHDIFKEVNLEEVLKSDGYSDIISKSDLEEYKALWHGRFAAKYILDNLKELPIEISEMVKYHTTSRVEATLEEKIIFLADLIEFNRSYKEVDIIREETEKNFLNGYELAIFYSLEYLVKQKKPIANISISVYNDLLLNKRDKKLEDRK